MRNINLNIQEALWTPSNINIKRSTQRHIIVKILIDKGREKLLKVIRVTAYLSSEVMEVKKKWEDILSAEEKNCESRILYSEKVSFKSEGKIKIFPDELKLR